MFFVLTSRFVWMTCFTLNEFLTIDFTISCALLIWFIKLVDVHGFTHWMIKSSLLFTHNDSLLKVDSRLTNCPFTSTVHSIYQYDTTLFFLESWSAMGFCTLRCTNTRLLSYIQYSARTTILSFSPFFGPVPFIHGRKICNVTNARNKETKVKAWNH